MGRRMGGVDKGLVLLDGRPMVAHVIERLAPQVGALVINANQNLDRYAAFGYPGRAATTSAASPGPLAGLHAGMSRGDARRTSSTAPCDSPFLPLDLVARLAAGLERASARSSRSRTRSRSRIRCSRWSSRDVLPHLTAFLDGGGRKIDAWYATLRVAAVPFDDEDRVPQHQHARRARRGRQRPRDYAAARRPRARPRQQFPADPAARRGVRRAVPQLRADRPLDAGAAVARRAGAQLRRARRQDLFRVSGFLVTQSWLARQSRGRRSSPRACCASIRRWSRRRSSRSCSPALSSSLAWAQFLSHPQTLDYAWRVALGLGHGVSPARRVSDQSVPARRQRLAVDAADRAAPVRRPAGRRRRSASSRGAGRGSPSWPRSWRRSPGAPDWFPLSPNDSVVRELALLFALGSLAYVWRDAHSGVARRRGRRGAARRVESRAARARRAVRAAARVRRAGRRLSPAAAVARRSIASATIPTACTSIRFRCSRR